MLRFLTLVTAAVVVGETLSETTVSNEKKKTPVVEPMSPTFFLVVQLKHLYIL